MRTITRIIAILESPNGRYYGFRFTRCADGAVVEGQISGGDSNIRHAFGYDHVKGGWRDDYYTHTQRTPEKEIFKLPNAGCSGPELEAYVQSQLPPLTPA